jgi:diguanylate cyclase (GGDEF)-like protein
MTNRSVLGRSLIGLVVLLIAVSLHAAEEPAALEKRLGNASGAEKVDVLLQLAEIHILRAPDKAVRYAEDALTGAKALSLAKPAARALLLRASGQYHLGDLDRALQSYEEGLVAAKALPDDLLIGGCLNGVAIVRMKRGDLAAALPAFDEAMVHLEKSGNEERLAAVTSNVSLIYYSRGEYDRALDLMQKSLGLYESIGDERGQGIVLNALGNVYNKLGEPKKARERFERTLVLAERTKHTPLMVSSLVNLGEIHGKNGQWDIALIQFRRALGLAREVGSRDLISVCLNNIGDALRETEDVTGALDHYRESMKIFEEMNARPRLVVSHLNMGRLFVKAGRTREAEASLKKAFDLAGEVGELTLRKEAAGELVKLYEGEGNYRGAYESQRAFNELKEQIFSKENYAKINSLEGKIDSERKARQIALLKKQGEIQVLRVKRQRLLIAFTVVAVLLLSAIVFLLSKRNRLKARTNAELSAAYARVEEMARTDALTGLLNRRAGMERLEQEVRRSERTRRPLSLVMIDVDDFKKINDGRGHACGDEVLRGLGGLLISSLRQLDVAARWGGEEFLVILPETSAGGALVIAEKLRGAVENLRVACDGGEAAFTITLGVSTSAADGPPLAECLRLADEALYAGKRAGKNRVVPAAGSTII